MQKRFVYMLSPLLFIMCAKETTPPKGTGILNDVQTTEVSNTGTTTVTCGGTITNNNGETITAKGVCWNTTGKPTVSNSKTVNSGGLQSFSNNVTNLTPSTTYYIRAYITSTSATAYGEEKTFKTKDVTPATITTAPATNVLRTTAISGGIITSDGGGTISVKGVCWATVSTPTISNSKTSDGTGTGTFASQLTNLLPNTTYYIRAYAVNQSSATPSYGEQIQIKTLPLSRPTVTTNTVSNVQFTTATCGGTIEDDGGGTILTKGVCWSTSPSPTTSNNKTSDGNSVAAFTSSLTGLTAGTKYYARAYATNTNSSLPSYGVEREFTTAAYSAPTVATDNVDRNITNTTAEVTGIATADGGASLTQRGFCWSTSSNPTIADAKTINGSGLGNFSATLTGLIPGQLYYVRSYAFNSGYPTPGYSTPVPFTTCNVTSFSNASTFQMITPSATNMSYNGGSSFSYQVTMRNTSVLFGTADRVDIYKNELLVYTLGTNLVFSSSNVYTATILKSAIAAGCCYTIRVKKGAQIYVSPVFSITN